MPTTEMIPQYRIIFDKNKMYFDAYQKCLGNSTCKEAIGTP